METAGVSEIAIAAADEARTQRQEMQRARGMNVRADVIEGGREISDGLTGSRMCRDLDIRILSSRLGIDRIPVFQEDRKSRPPSLKNIDCAAAAGFLSATAPDDDCRRME